MKIIAALLFCLTSATILAQPTGFDELLDQGKDEFYRDFDSQDYQKAVALLEEAVKLKPNHAEARYFLGYAYSRLNSKDGKGMTAMCYALTVKSSEQFEMVNKLTPKYNGEMLALDPYSKLTAEWGSLAMCYLYHNKQDSAMFAFREGKRRGGFGEFFLETNRKSLDFCSRNAILISSGDNSTIPLWYLQFVEKYRTDVSVIDISLINSVWYPDFMEKNSRVSFGLTKKQLDSIQFMPWTDSVVKIGISQGSSFSWTVKPTYLEKYLLRGDILFLHLLTENRFKRDVYFTAAFIEESRLGLGDKLNTLILIDRINYDNKPVMSFEEFRNLMAVVTGCLDHLNPNSQLELDFVDNIRYVIFSRTNDCLNNSNTAEAAELMKIIDASLGFDKYPSQWEKGQQYYDYFKERIGN